MKTGDTVKVISGKLKGETAKIVRVARAEGKVFLENLRVVERHLKKSQANPNGGSKSIHQGIHISNVKLVESAPAPKSKKAATKVKVDTKADKKSKKEKK